MMSIKGKMTLELPGLTYRHTLACLVDRILSGAWMKLHSSMMGTFFVYTLVLRMAILKKLFIVVTMKSLELFPEISSEFFFLKIGILIT